ncbi:hypothetical protein [Cupriavidus consociatus]|uniref:hypothetical protein n=1 Tax=Cupriavidus consociatus TaxID=2821357 RepID=UPI001AE6C660|nr:MULTISPECIES: hypothetical protein [unclassified Cupriavidus]MBP0622421.1 hypothetical protein [Cupriavidus sp. LEh25]MDK2659108.1 hypothetical protein [Cupriavidus sp. LEh21]
MAMLIMRMAVEGYAIAWLPFSAVKDEIDAGRFVQAGGEEWCAKLQIRSYRAIANSNPTMQDLWNSLETSVPPYDASEEAT